MTNAYPTTTDLAAYLAATGFLSELAVTTGAASATQTLSATAILRPGDQLYFAAAAALRTISAVPSSTTVTLSATVTTTTGEAVFRVPAVYLLGPMLDAGIASLERSIGRKIFALQDQTRNFDPPREWHGVLDLKTDLRAITSVVVAGVTQTLYTDYRPLPEDADEDERPWSMLQFKGRWLSSYIWQNQRIVAVTGRFGYGTEVTGIPEDLWMAACANSLLIRLPQIAAATTQGLISWTEADVTEEYGVAPYQGLIALYQTTVADAVHRYRRVAVG